MSRGRGQAPDFIEPIVAYRAWRYSFDERGARLGALGGAEEPWAGACGGWVTAACLSAWSSFGPAVGPHVAPLGGCSCGFYAVKAVDDAAELVMMDLVVHGLIASETYEADDVPSDDVGSVLGRVELAGKVIEHEHGFRAQRARVLELIPLGPDDTRTDPLAHRLGVPLAEPCEVPEVEIYSTGGLPPPFRPRGPTKRVRPLTLIERLRLMSHQRAFQVLRGIPDEEESS
jgi:hypothetical protein